MDPRSTFRRVNPGSLNAPGIEWFGQPIGVGKDKSLPRSIQRKISYASVVDVIVRRISSGRRDPIFLIALHSMDSYQFWIYVIVAIIYLVSRAIKKSNRQARGPSQGREPQHTEQETERLPPVTFEELLREITEGKKRKAEPPARQPVPPPPPAPRPVPREYIDYDEELEDEEKSLERVDYDKEREATTLQVYERARREAELKSSLGTLKSSLGPQGALKSSLKSLESSLQGTARTVTRHRLVDEYIRELKTPSGFRKAVVLSEILKPKF